MSIQGKMPRRSANKSKFAGKIEFYDSVTGEKVGEQTKYKTERVKQDFVTMYLNDENLYPLLAGLGSSGKVLGYIMKEYNDKTGMFYFSSTRKEMMIKDLSLSIGTVRSSVRDFVNSGLLLRVSGSEYMINPHVFYKGPQALYDTICVTFDDLKKVDDFKRAQKSIDAKAVKV